MRRPPVPKARAGCAHCAIAGKGNASAGATPGVQRERSRFLSRPAEIAQSLAGAGSICYLRTGRLPPVVAPDAHVRGDARGDAVALGLEWSPGCPRALHCGTPECLRSPGRHARQVAAGNRSVPESAGSNRSAEIAPSLWARGVSVLCDSRGRETLRCGAPRHPQASCQVVTPRRCTATRFGACSRLEDTAC